METELKFQVPAARAAALHKAVATATARTTRLAAIYLDTPDRALAAAGLAWRLRREGPRWVQTLKGRGDGIGQRVEHEVVLPRPRGEPAPDAARHDGTAAGVALRAALGNAAVVAVFRTDIRRTHRIVRSGGATIEIAHDRGAIVAGGRRAAVDEIEFELKAGPRAALPALAARWVARFGLWWDVRTKAERGQRLAAFAEAAARVPAVRAVPSAVAGDMAPHAAFAVLAAQCLAQALPNAAEIADGAGSAEHLHQLRVGLRRLRTLLRDGAPWSADPEAARALDAAWRGPFAALGVMRDADVLAADVLAGLRAAGGPAPAVAPPPAAVQGAAPADVVRGAAFQQLALRTLELAWREPAAPPPQPGSEAPEVPAGLPEAAARWLRQARKRALQDAAGFAGAAVEAQHRTRRRIKRLRYAIEFLLPVLRPRGAARRLLRRAMAAGEALGRLNDLAVAAAAFERQVDAEPRAWFALGWIAAERARALAEAASSLEALRRAGKPGRQR